MKTIAQLINWDFETNGRLEIKDKNGNRIYLELSNGYWSKMEYNSQEKEIYYENSQGFWAKWEYDSEGNEIYYKNSNGTIIDNRPKPSKDKVVEIYGIKYKLVRQ